VNRHGRVGGPLSPRAVAEIVKRCAALVGLDAADFGGHSLRSGFVTSAARAGKTMDAIMRVTGHEDVRTAAGYLRGATLFDGVANKDFGL